MNARFGSVLSPIFGSIVVFGVSLAACSSSTDDGSCHPGDTSCNHTTTGSDGGGSSANEDAGSSAQSDSGSTTSTDSGSSPHNDGGHGQGTGDGGGSSPDSGLGPEGGAGGFGATCNVNTDCPSTYPVCFTFNNGKGKHCTKTCQSATDCPNPPNLGCNGMGVCKVP